MNFTIAEGADFYCEFTIKEPGASIPMDVAGATGTFILSTIGIDTCVVITQPMTVVDGPNGLMSVSLTAEQTTGLESRVGFPEDGYLPVATYKALLDITATEPINVLIPKVYITSGGETCPA